MDWFIIYGIIISLGVTYDYIRANKSLVCEIKY